MSAPLLQSVGMIDDRTIEVKFDQAMSVDAELTNKSNYLITPAPPGSIVSVSAIGSDTVRIKLPTDLLSGGSYELQVSNVKSSIGEFISAQAVSLFTGIGTPPTFSSASAVSKSKIRVQFSEPMDPALLVDPDLWSVTSATTGKRVEVSGVALVDDGTGLFRDVEIFVSSKMTNGGEHVISGLGLADAAGNPQSTGDMIVFTGIADLPRILSAQLDDSDSGRLIVTFDSPMDRSFATPISSWRVESPAIVPRVYISKVDLSEDRKNATLYVSESKNGSLYAAQASGSVVDDYGNTLEPNYSYRAFYGIGEAPTLVRWSRVGKNRIDVYFSESMLDGVEIRNSSRYSIDNGASVVSVLAVEGNVVKLATTDLVSEILYTLTIS